MKKILALLCVLFTMTGIVACSPEQGNNVTTPEEQETSADLGKAYLKGYDKEPLEEACNKAAEEAIKRGKAENKDMKFSFLWGKGWVGDYEPEKIELGENEKYVMCELRMTITQDGREEKKRMKVYMIHDTEENTVTVHAGNDIGLYVTMVSADETRQRLMDFIEGNY